MLMKVTIRAILLGIASMLSIAAYARADEPKHIDIPSGDLSQALLRLSKQYGADLVYRPEQVHGLKTHGVHGEFTTEQAVTRLLQGTPLELRTDSSGAMLIAPPIVGAEPGADTSQPSIGALAQGDDSKEGKKSSSGGFQLAQVSSGQAAGPVPITQASSVASASIGSELQEIVVTAQKREQRLIDVPIAVSVVDAQALVESNQTQLHEYFNQIPGLALAQSTVGASIVSIRGITTGINQNPTVGFTLDDIPLGASTLAGGAGLVPEINPADLARIEVLKGPQGTLYGASSMGGLVRFVTLDPSTDGIFGSVQAGTDEVHNGRNLGYSFYGTINIPLSSTLAVRASGFVRDNPGFVDNVETGQRGINQEDIAGGRLSALWQLSPEFSLKLGALLESDNRNGANDVYLPTSGYPFTANLHGLQQYDLYGTGQYDRKVQVYSATLNGKVGGVDLTAISGYSANSASASEDLSYLFGSPTTFPNSGKTDKFTQEIRLSSQIGSHVDVRLGGFYTHEASSFNQGLLAIDSTNHQLAGTLLYLNAPVNYKETAGFGDLTWKATDQFVVQMGGRYSHLTVTALPEFETGSLLGGSSTSPASAVSANVFTYLVSPQYKINPDLTLYGRVANGYRPGGGEGNPSPAALCVEKSFPCSYQPDKTTDYELGMKGDFLDRALFLDASFYYIDWKNLQLNLVAPGDFAFTGNGSRAKSEGIEIAIEAHPLAGLSVSGWVSWDNAALTKVLPPGPDVGQAGDRLPYTSRFSGNIAVREEFPIVQDVNGNVALKVTYIGDRTGEFTSTELRQDLPAYTQTDFHTGITYQLWQGSLYINNLTDSRGIVLGGIGTAYPFAFDYIQPRTVGLTLSRKF